MGLLFSDASVSDKNAGTRKGQLHIRCERTVLMKFKCALNFLLSEE
jgi:hypothetical protein